MTTQQQVKAFIQECEKQGFSIVGVSNVITIQKTFSPGDNDTFIQCDMFACSTLGLVPVRKGSSSMWGTDGGSIGGAMALQNGRFQMNVSGVQKRFANELRKALASV